MYGGGQGGVVLYDIFRCPGDLDQHFSVPAEVLRVSSAVNDGEVIGYGFPTDHRCDTREYGGMGIWSVGHIESLHWLERRVGCGDAPCPDC